MPKRYADEFYDEVAQAYRRITQVSPYPNKVISEERGVPLKTAQRWVAEARRRGLLAGGVKGRAGDADDGRRTCPTCRGHGWVGAAKARLHGLCLCTLDRTCKPCSRHA